MAKEKVLIAVKTYPTISDKYKELACTAGFREDGSWIRLYPIPFRLLDEEQQYKKYQWVEADIVRNTGDPRPESHRILGGSEIKLLGEVSTDREWADRRKLVLGNQRLYTNLREIIVLAHDNMISLVVFKPAEVLAFVAEAAEPEWPQNKINGILDSMKQGHLFADQSLDDFKIMPKLPYKFSYRFKDDAGVESKLMIEDWEIGQLYWNCERHTNGTSAKQEIPSSSSAHSIHRTSPKTACFRSCKSGA
jgi:hypothetical protein